MTSQIPEGAIIITPTEVYNKVVNLTDQVTRLLEREAVDPLPSKVTDLEGKVDKLDTRVSSLERKVWIASGFAAALGGVAGQLLQAAR